MAIFGVTVMLMVVSCLVPSLAQDPCISSCVGQSDGDYQSCIGCTVYATCSGEVLTDNRACSGDLVWDDTIKECNYTSSTCPACVSSCVGQSDGDYQSCIGCTVYATCSGEVLTDNRACSGDLVWDDTIKECNFTSSTCPGAPAVVAPGVCITDCYMKATGDYQSCIGCNVFATCSNGILFDNRTCFSSSLEWDDNTKRCEYNSTTCTNDVCITSCSGLTDGNYQSCNGCAVYATCSFGNLIDNRPCGSGTVWDDISKTCGFTSTTCTEDT